MSMFPTTMAGAVLFAPPMKVSPVPDDVAAELSTNVVALVTELTVAPTGMFGPVIDIPANNPAVLAQVAVVLAFVVAPLISVTLGDPSTILPVPFTINAEAGNAVSANPEPVPMAGKLSTKVVPSVIELTVALAGILTPTISIPWDNPAVLEQVIVVEAFVVAQLARVTGFIPGDRLVAVKIRPDPVPVAAALSTNVVILVIELTFAPEGILVPKTVMPTASEAVLEQVTVVLALVVLQPLSVVKEVPSETEFANRMFSRPLVKVSPELNAITPPLLSSVVVFGVLSVTRPPNVTFGCAIVRLPASTSTVLRKVFADVVALDNVSATAPFKLSGPAKMLEPAIVSAPALRSVRPVGPAKVLLPASVSVVEGSEVKPCENTLLPVEEKLP